MKSARDEGNLQKSHQKSERAGAAWKRGQAPRGADMALRVIRDARYLSMMIRVPRRADAQERRRRRSSGQGLKLRVRPAVVCDSPLRITGGASSTVCASSSPTQLDETRSRRATWIAQFWMIGLVKVLLFTVVYPLGTRP